MRIQKIILIIGLLSITSYITTAQELTQVIRGQVIDAESQTPLSFVSIAILNTNPILGGVTDEEGYFRLEEVPIGRHDLKVSFIGYETKIMPELMVSTGKEIVLTIKMKEQIIELKGVTVKSYTKKDKPLNDMATLSARTFSVEEARRYAGGWDDPGRLVSSFAGVTTENTRDNTIIIRGNPPKGLLWRLEGVEIPNPNHFANLSTFGSGGISALSSLVVGNSDFYTGAFPAEYGNAMSGVFDIKLRAGNNENYEHAFQIGTLGIDLSSEGPIGKNSRASYLFNYRYSTFGLVKSIFPEEVKDFMPVYQDFSFKINMPTNKSGIFSIWGFASDDLETFKAEQDTSKWEMIDDRMDGTIKQSIGSLGLNHRYIFQKNAWLNTSIALTGSLMKYEGGILDYDLTHYENEYMDAFNYKYTFTSVFNRKFSAKHSNRTGFIVGNKNYNILSKYAPDYEQGLITIADENDNSYFLRAFSQSKISLTNNLIFNVGLHSQYFALNKEMVLEPRLGVTYNISKAQSVSLAYGKHSRLEPLTLYFAEVNDGGNITQPNKDMKVSKAHHLVFAYDLSLNPNLRLKIEPYFQYLYDVPVIPDSSFSVINIEADWYFNQELINTGTGKNIGIDFTLERFLQDGYYYLFTASLFNSKYTGDDGIERNTRYNTNYVFNLLYGKEWIVGKQDNKIIGVNIKLNFFGGKRTTPVDDFASDLAQDVVYDYSLLFEDKDPDKFHMNATINYRKNKKNYSSVWSLQMVNLLMAKENYGLYYNYKTQQVERWEFAVPVPNLSYKIEF